MDRLGTSVRPFALLAAEQVPDVDDSETNPCLDHTSKGQSDQTARRIMRVFRVFRFFRELGNWAMMILALKVGCVCAHNTN